MVGSNELFDGGGGKREGTKTFLEEINPTLSLGTPLIVAEKNLTPFTIYTEKITRW